MKIICSNDTTFLESIPHLTPKLFVKNKLAFASLVKPDIENFASYSADLGNVAIDFLYDPLFEQIVGFLEVSKELVSQIKRGEAEQWTKFSAFAYVMFNNGNMHPFYYPLFVHVAEAFRNEMRNAAGELLEDDFFCNQAIGLEQLKEKVATLLDAQNNVEDIEDVVRCYQRVAFQKPVQLTNVYAEILSDAELTMVVYPQVPEEIWNYLLPFYVIAGMRFKRCDNCKRFFASTGRGNPKFCERLIEGVGKTCRQVMPKLNFNSKADKDPAVYLYNRAYKTMYSRVTTGTMEKAMFKEWAKRARAMRDACSAATMTAEEYSTWLCDNGLFIDYLKK